MFESICDIAYCIYPHSVFLGGSIGSMQTQVSIKKVMLYINFGM